MKKHLIKLNSEDFCKITEDILQKGHLLRFRANGRSMAPTIIDGDIVTITPPAADLIRTGTIVLHRSPNSKHPLLHRIIKTEHRNSGTAMFTRGDTFCGHTERITTDDILGIAVEVTHRGKTKKLNSFRQRLHGRLRTARQNFRALARNLIS
jgi:hypothetical protein